MPGIGVSITFAVFGLCSVFPRFCGFTPGHLDFRVDRPTPKQVGAELFVQLD